ncbi:MAG: uroporphyrin-III C-methyltransferase [Peptococcaceae bacterium]|nr:uroporphyrin-III C-methyltransferase [Peptococcaceae bacterium]
MNVGKVYLIGAGPGDPKLITVKGLECIKEADCIVYDRLASPRLLSYARKDAELIFVGKSPERHVLKQEEINELLVKLSLDGKTVARLKGGDPFVFGRGGEEAEVLREHQIPFEVVPGITSAIAVPAYAGIPVTHRDYTSTFTIITGHEDPLKDDSRIEWPCLASRSGTLVFLMGMENLPLIVGQLMKHGKDPGTPVAVIRWGTRPEQQTVTGNLANIEVKVEEAGLTSPAIIIVGEVVQLREKLSWFEGKPLFGKRIVVTRSREQASQLSEEISRLGGEVLEFPTIAITEPDDYGPLDQAIREIKDYQWLIFTSVNGVQHFFKRFRDLGRDIRELYNLRLSAIGPATAWALAEKGFLVDYVPQEFRAEAIVEGLKSRIKPGDRVLLPRADIARALLPQELIKLGAHVTEVDVYKTVKEKSSVRELLNYLKEKKISVVTFTSSSTVVNFVEMLGEDNLSLLEGVVIACIGPITAQTVQEYGLKVEIQAEEYTIPGLVKAILAYYH